MKRWQYLTALTILTAAAVIALLNAAEQRADLVRDLEAENAYLTRRLDQSMKQLQQLTDRIIELELDCALKNTGLAGLGQAFYGAEKAYGVNGVILAAICAHESGWGRSRLARERNNLAGLGAYSAGMGMAFESRADCIEYLARLLAGRPGTLAEVGRWYAEDPGWAAKVAGCVRVIVERTETHECDKERTETHSGYFQNRNNQGGE